MKEITAGSTGDIDRIDALEVGLVSVMLGAGRMKVDDAIDPKAGILLRSKVGDSVNRGETLAVMYTDRKGVIDEAAHRLSKAFALATEPSMSQPLITKVIDDQGTHPWTRYGTS